MLLSQSLLSLHFNLFPSLNSDHLSLPPISMESCSDLHEWELVLGSNLSDNLKAAVAPEEETEDGTLKPKYFTLDSGGHNSPHSEKERDEGIDDSENPSWADPDSDSRLLESSRGRLSFVGLQVPIRDSGGFWSDESSDGKRSLPDSEKMERGSLSDSVMETASEGCENSMIHGGGGSIEDGEKKENVWWKMPVELLKFCIFRVRPVWSLTIAAAMVGIVLLGRKLYGMKHKSRSVALRIAIDDKKISQFASRTALFNEAMSVVRRMPIIRPSLPAGGVTQLAALPLR